MPSRGSLDPAAQHADRAQPSGGGGEGNDVDPRGVFDQNKFYDPGTNTWRSLQRLPLAVHGLTGAAYLEGLIHVPGGATFRSVSGANVTFAHQVYRASLTRGPPA